jgi:hypothetical protein
MYEVVFPDYKAFMLNSQNEMGYWAIAKFLKLAANFIRIFTFRGAFRRMQEAYLNRGSLKFKIIKELK